MKKYLWIIILLAVILVLGILAIVFSPENYLKETSYKTIENKIENKDSFIFYIKSTECEHCKVFTPTFKGVLSEYKVPAYTINIDKLSDKDNKKYEEEFSDVEGTPTVLFFNNGKRQLITIEGEQTKVKIISKLKTAGFIK